MKTAKEKNPHIIKLNFISVTYLRNNFAVKFLNPLSLQAYVCQHVSAALVLCVSYFSSKGCL